MEQPLRSRRDYVYDDLEEELEKRKKESANKEKIENIKNKKKKGLLG